MSNSWPETNGVPASCALIFQNRLVRYTSPSATDVTAQSLHCNSQSNSSRSDTRSRKTKSLQRASPGPHPTLSFFLTEYFSRDSFRKFRSFCIVYRRWVPLCWQNLPPLHPFAIPTALATLDNSSMAHEKSPAVISKSVNLASSGITLLTVPA